MHKSGSRVYSDKFNQPLAKRFLAETGIALLAFHLFAVSVRCVRSWVHRVVCIHPLQHVELLVRRSDVKHDVAKHLESSLESLDLLCVGLVDHFLAVPVALRSTLAVILLLLGERFLLGTLLASDLPFS